MRKSIATISLILLCGCQPYVTGHADYDTATGGVTAGVDIEIKDVYLETTPGSGIYEKRSQEIHHHWRARNGVRHYQE